ncbi:MAG: ABC transporter ATP-binding protein [Oscillospiraceae bacterium]|nr:ABC transporter ATP-binding protein [Oscillospiraceae bacterium]
MVRVRNLKLIFSDHGEPEEVVHGISFDIHDGEIVGIVGESGSGKTQTALAMAGLSPRHAKMEGEISIDGKNLVDMNRNQLRAMQGSEIAMVFQEPMTSLNPTMRIGKQVEEALAIHTKLSKAERKALALQAMKDVEIPDVERSYRKYPHEMSGGQRQRVMIASAIIGSPKLLIADEPTTALDVTIQAEILKLLQKLNREKGMSILFISHDLRVIRKLCSRVIVMNRGVIVEEGPVEEVFNHPKDDYTKKLIASIPVRRRAAE